jgi:hypothetical protein
MILLPSVVKHPVQEIEKVAGQEAHRLTDLLTRLAGTGETARDADDGHRAHQQVSETRRDVGDRGDVCRVAHDPEVGGSNPSPATKARGPFSNRERAFCVWFAHGRARSDDLPGPMTCRPSGQRLTSCRVWSCF